MAIVIVSKCKLCVSVCLQPPAWHYVCAEWVVLTASAARCLPGRHCLLRDHHSYEHAPLRSRLLCGAVPPGARGEEGGVGCIVPSLPVMSPLSLRFDRLAAWQAVLLLARCRSRKTKRHAILLIMATEATGHSPRLLSSPHPAASFPEGAMAAELDK